MCVAGETIISTRPELLCRGRRMHFRVKQGQHPGVPLRTQAWIIDSTSGQSEERLPGAGREGEQVRFRAQMPHCLNSIMNTSSETHKRTARMKSARGVGPSQRSTASKVAGIVAKENQPPTCRCERSSTDNSPDPLVRIANLFPVRRRQRQHVSRE